MENMDFTTKLLKLIADYESYDDLIWFVKDDKISFWIKCNDLFYWATGDAEPVTESNIDLLEKSLKECDELLSVWGSQLFCCRNRKLQPQVAIYKQLSREPDNAKLIQLFEQAGPKPEPS